jgi:hypothetical protein
MSEETEYLKRLRDAFAETIPLTLAERNQVFIRLGASVDLQSNSSGKEWSSKLTAHAGELKGKAASVGLPDFVAKAQVVLDQCINFQANPAPFPPAWQAEILRNLELFHTDFFRC